MKIYFMIFATSILLIGCAAREPGISIKSATPVSITIWGKSQTPIFSGPLEVSDQMMTDLAERHCSKYGKHARRAMQRYVDNSGGAESWREFTYNCI